jgi:hypothetical protein
MRPICVHCGKLYGRRATTTEKVRWDTPLIEVKTTRGDVIIQAKEPTAPPPPYRGNGTVVQERHAYLSADDHRMVMERDIWDGESWSGGYKPFCTLRCALDYARKAYARSKR